MIFLPSAFRCNRHWSWRTRPEAPARRRVRARSIPARLERLVNEERASAPIELAIGAVAILAVSAVAFDLYSLTRANAAGERIAATMADYVSQESAPDGDEMAALGKFLHERELRMPSALVYVISAVHQPAGGDPAEKLWSDAKIRFGEEEDTAALAQECQSRGRNGWFKAMIGADATLKLEANSVVIVVEVCAKLEREGRLSEMVAGNLYRIHALPARGTGGKPSEPSHSTPSEAAAASTGEGTWPTASLQDLPTSSLRHVASDSVPSAQLGKVA